MAKKYILALDQGTTSSRSILFDHAGTPVASAQREFRQIYPKAGWVEHDPEEIWASQLATAEQVLRESGVGVEEVAAMGITNQRETTVVWERATGKPVYNAIVWQCRRTAERCRELKEAGHEALFQARTGLVLDAYFSGTKVAWILEQIPEGRKRAEAGDLCFGTVDAWLLFKLTGRHATDYSNASRTLLFNIETCAWDPELLSILGVPAAMLPEALPTSHHFGDTTILGGSVPVCSLVGDQQAALFGQAAFSLGEAKNTYGTGCFLLMNIGKTCTLSKHGLLTTVAWGLDGEVTYALEGSVFIGGAVIQWLRDELGMLQSAAESETLAAAVEDTNGVHIVPAFVGLGAPYWDMEAKGIITGLTRGVNRNHLVRAALESISYQSADVVETMALDTGVALKTLRVDGGASANNLLMQHQSDCLGIGVERGKTIETTALGAAYLAGICVGFWNNKSELINIWQLDRRFDPQWTLAEIDTNRHKWHHAVRQTRTGDHGPSPPII
ncbi:MAG: glycerol kinase GlpK [Candidatus Hydrogenedentes bacterium]|nr:glycerol kinase GlpK [Candidatus Hydrogenedentota bacterium]